MILGVGFVYFNVLYFMYVIYIISHLKLHEEKG